MSRSVLVTGTSSGIGLACVERFHAAGYSVVATVRKEGDAATLRSRFPGITTLVLDLADEASIDRVIGAELARRGGVDVVVNNAGASIVGAVEDLSMRDYRAQMELNLFAAIRVTQLALPYLRARRSGAIVQLSSGFGRITLPMFSAYCASKYALEGFTEALAFEMAPFGVHVSLVEPGPVATRFDANRREAERYDVDGPYASMYRAMRERLTGSHREGASSAEDAAEAVFRAATSSSPALRYPVGRMGHAANVAARFVPDRLKQLLFGRMAKG